MINIFNKQNIREYVEKELLKREEYKNFKIDFIMSKGIIRKSSYCILSDYDDCFVGVIQDKNGKIDITEKFRVLKTGDVIVFNLLEHFFMKIEYMDYFVHYELCREIENDFLNTENWIGMNKYIKYCMQNNITKEKIDKEIGQKITPDITKYYDSETLIEKIKNLVTDRQYYD